MSYRGLAWNEDVVERQRELDRLIEENEGGRVSPQRLRRAASLHDRLGKLIREQENEEEEGEGTGGSGKGRLRSLRRRHTLSRLPQSSASPPKDQTRVIRAHSSYPGPSGIGSRPFGFSTQMTGLYLSLGLGVPILVLLLYLSLSTLCLLSITHSSSLVILGMGEAAINHHTYNGVLFSGMRRTMSFRGFKKAINRLPAQFLNKTGKLEVEADPELAALARQFEEFERASGDLLTDSCKFRKAVLAMVDSQVAFSNTLIELYDLPGTNTPTPTATLDAARTYVSIISRCNSSITPLLSTLESVVIRPTENLVGLLQNVRKTLDKCGRKQLDYVRHNQSLSKLSTKTERSLEEERKMHKQQTVTDESHEAYQNIIARLKTDLPILFQLRSQLIQPMFKTFARVQLRVQDIYYNQLEEVTRLGVFDMQSPIVEHFTARQAEGDSLLGALNFPGGKPSATSPKPNLSGKSPSSSQPPSPNPATAAATSEEKAKLAGQTTSSGPTSGAVAGTGAMAGATSATVPHSTTAGSSIYPPPPPPPPVSATTTASSSYVVALYDYTAQDSGDLSFSEGDRIQVLHRSMDTNDWWKGTINGKTGVFPANYVREE
ncbi:hypothetical protein BJ684DRAFT_15273 [Piptocephalis cylindrospora]|uniref:BAR domain-containing protein n=1 Tax=Piptocephalis cylindrospora TaxID=1907219 RepID=A0A4V1IYF7_9FUNG|nr:hypothetical protein BJ684DRAFT_15273 [Piptocephalis cylindrospora]|eukprot:RKP14399.1 hypothetical protein BJ684DRAFT_15273 [Piptocephalis cylindrospora]